MSAVNILQIAQFSNLTNGAKSIIHESTRYRERLSTGKFVSEY